MKSKEEIEQLANEYGYASAYSKEEHKAFINGYTQCQEDIRKDWQSYTISEKADFIEFLNEQG